ncbi:YsnF/AvaK domain-containing protein [Larkinella soli]|uniref:YsnF/AvaK domain-containing protein n=1 Tax=Larkinella soli TaxID=1770527 RepID=UPI000FFBE787|nr:YsnF/AvaK domain-containing protein [Larkinella soli]
MAQTVIGLFDNEAEARQAVQQLVSNGFTHDDIDISTENSTTSGTVSERRTDRDDDNDSFGDSIGNFFSSLFGSNDEADRYSEVARRLRSLVTVYTDSAEEAERAADILDDAGAVNVDERAQQYGYAGRTGITDASTTTGYAATGTTDETTYGTTDTTNLRDTDLNDTGSIKVVEENLQVGKREVTTGGARLRSRVVEKPVEETLRLRQEHVRVNRQAVDRPATEADFSNFKEGEIELTERAEVPVVNKEARVVEEVSLSKEVEEREETIRDTVRKTEVDVENLNRDRDQLTDRDIDQTRNRSTDNTF